MASKSSVRDAIESPPPVPPTPVLTVELPPEPVEEVRVVELALVPEFVVVTLLVGPLGPAAVDVDVAAAVVAVELATLVEPVTLVELVTLVDIDPAELFMAFAPEVVVEPPIVDGVPPDVSEVGAPSSEQPLELPRTSMRMVPPNTSGLR